MIGVLAGYIGGALVGGMDIRVLARSIGGSTVIIEFLLTLAAPEIKTLAH